MLIALLKRDEVLVNKIAVIASGTVKVRMDFSSELGIVFLNY